MSPTSAARVLAARPAPRRQQTSQPLRRVLKEIGLLFKIDADATEENRRGRALILLVQREREIKRHHCHVVSGAAQLRHQRVVTETISAIHRARARSDLNNVHDRILGATMAIGFAFGQQQSHPDHDRSPGRSA
jgi:hypothetical protein